MKKRCFKEIGLFCGVLKNSPYSMGQYVKTFSCVSSIIEEHLDLFCIVMNYCHNAEKLVVPHNFLNYIYGANCKKLEEEGKVLWKNLQKINDSYTYADSGNLAYPCLYAFRDSLTNLSALFRPKMKFVDMQDNQLEYANWEDEYNEGSQEDVSRFIQSSKIRSHYLSHLMFWTLFLIWRGIYIIAQLA